MKMLRAAATTLAGFASRYRIALASTIAVLAVLLVTPVVLVSVAPGSLFGRYHDVAANYEDMRDSRHAEVDCVACHTSQQGRAIYSIALVGDFYANIVSPTDEPRFLRFESPSREACLACHETAWSKEMQRIARVPHPAHLRVADETRQCVECHKWTAHEEVYMQEHKEMPFSGICVAYGCHSGFRSEDECTSCHHALRDEP
ncbi:MAG TPA: hypothetical protein VFH17_06035, partial [Coriobacteriia bacterium]|nr:hypothetical protein [Coriobacteriia bacterium]